MYNSFRELQYQKYNEAKEYFETNYNYLIDLEKYFSQYMKELLSLNIAEIVADYNEASFLFPFWQNYPPDDRGRKPKGDQYPWIEVGEHAVGCKIGRLLDKDFMIRDTGIPTGPDQRFVLKNRQLLDITSGFTDSCWLFIDIKSVGPRDDFDHIVMSHNQISGDGKWENKDTGIINEVMQANGVRTSHDFHCSVPPIYVLSDGTILPIVLMAIKPVYKMLSLEGNGLSGQPLRKISIITIPNGILLQENPKYLQSYPKLLFPGKDDKGKNPLKVRCRISFEILKKIDLWRVEDIILSE